MKTKVELLIDILLDPKASLTERDDAAIELSSFDDEHALKALLRVAKNKNEDEMIAASCGESIASMWIRMNKFDFDEYFQMHHSAKSSIDDHIVGNKPE